MEISVDIKNGEGVVVDTTPPKLEVARPNRAARRAQLKEARRGYSVVLSEGQKRDHAMVVAKKAWCKRRSGNPLKAATMFFSWVEIQNAFRGHV